MNDNDNNNDTHDDAIFIQPGADPIEQLRIIAANKLQELYAIVRQRQQHRDPQQLYTIPSWVHQHHQGSDDTKINHGNEKLERSEQSIFFDYTGFIHVPNFVTSGMCEAMKDEIHHIVETQWDPDKTLGDTFGTNEEQNISRGNYFLSSANQVHFFTEPKAMEDIVVPTEDSCNNQDSTSSDDDDDDDIGVDVDTNDTTTTLKKKTHPTQSAPQLQHQRLKSEYCTPQTKILALNKIGHGLHLIPDSTFQQYTLSENVCNLVNDLGWRDPVVPQSMYIFKQPNHIGGVVNSHQDSTFLYTDPYPTCIGLWLALDDATIENGCLWVRPGSHNNFPNENECFNSQQKHNVRRQYRRNVLHFGNDTIQERCNIPTGDTIHQPMFEMVQLFHDPTVPWDGSIPTNSSVNTTTAITTPDTVLDSDRYTYEALLQAGFVPIECKAGDLLAFTGTLDHLSLGNSCTNSLRPSTLLSNDNIQSSFSSLPSSRHTFQLHIVEGPSQGIEWSKYNWLQYPNNEPFVRLNANCAS